MVVCIFPPSSFCISWLKTNSMESLLYTHICLFKSFFSPFLGSWPEIQNSISKCLLLLLNLSSSYIWSWVHCYILTFLKSVSPKPHLSTWLWAGCYPVAQELTWHWCFPLFSSWGLPCWPEFGSEKQLFSLHCPLSVIMGSGRAFNQQIIWAPAI